MKFDAGKPQHFQILAVGFHPSNAHCALVQRLAARAGENSVILDEMYDPDSLVPLDDGSCKFALLIKIYQLNVRVGPATNKSRIREALCTLD